MTKKTLAAVLAIAVIAVFATIAIATSISGDSGQQEHMMPGGQMMNDDDQSMMDGQDQMMDDGSGDGDAGK
ncbi:MAG: hypothetical protein HZB14_07630 [Actinobacteria bacterium]|nr:hypothetical protein [Actinomycetota bacterium]